MNWNKFLFMVFLLGFISYTMLIHASIISKGGVSVNTTWFMIGFLGCWICTGIFYGAIK